MQLCRHTRCLSVALRPIYYVVHWLVALVPFKVCEKFIDELQNKPQKKPSKITRYDCSNNAATTKNADDKSNNWSK